MINSIFHFCHKYIHNITTVTIDASIPSKGGRNEFIKKIYFIISYNNLLLRWELKIKKKKKTRHDSIVKCWLDCCLGSCDRFDRILPDLFSSTEFSERELPELLGAGAGFDLPTTFQSCVMVSIALSAILIISSFWESLHVEPPAAILNEGWQLLKGSKQCAIACGIC